MIEDETLGRRKEPRYKTQPDHSLLCDCFYHEDDPKPGSIIDVSSGGIRFLSEGKFSTGQTVLIELKTDHSHGAFGGIIRRIQPWVDGKFVLGCELIERLPYDVLEALAKAGVVNRRRDERIDWKQPAKLSWELQPGEIDIEIHDCSSDGMRISSPVEIPDDVRLRIRVEEGGDERFVVDAKSVWQLENEDQFLTGLAFITKELPDGLTQILSQRSREQRNGSIANREPAIRSSLLIAAAMILLGVTLMQTGFIR